MLMGNGVVSGEQTLLEADGRSLGGSKSSKQEHKFREPLKAERPAFEVPAVAPQTPEQPEGQGAEGDEPPSNGFLRRSPVASLIAGLLIAASLGGGYLYWDYASRFQSTDDAFIAARQIPIAPQVSGYVTEVPVTDNQHVPAGGVIAQIDKRPYTIALDQAKAQVQAAQAAIKNIDAQISVQDAQIKAAKAQADQAQAALVFAQQQAQRYEHLAGTGYGSVQNAQQYTSQLQQQQAAVETTKAALTVAERQIDSLKAQRGSAEASLAQAIAQRDQAELNLSYTTVTASKAGTIVNLTAERGEFVQPGTNLTMFVPDDIWVTANFKETQIDRMRPGQPLTLTIDAYPERDIRGHIASVQPGSGTAFSVLPAQNATGNYVKVVQRVPVKIVIDNPPTDVALGPGMSVVPSVRVDQTPSLYEWLFGRSDS